VGTLHGFANKLWPILCGQVIPVIADLEFNCIYKSCDIDGDISLLVFSVLILQDVCMVFDAMARLLSMGAQLIHVLALHGIRLYLRTAISQSANNYRVLIVLCLIAVSAMKAGSLACTWEFHTPEQSSSIRTTWHLMAFSDCHMI
jgi:hypothetical protein